MKYLLGTVLVSGIAGWLLPAEKGKSADALAASLRDLDGAVLPVLQEGEARERRELLARDQRRRFREANLRENQAWRAVRTRADWEKFRDARVEALRASLGPFPPVPKDLKVRITRRLDGDGYRIENLVFESRPGLVVTANLYLPVHPAHSMPGILISHSHHNPKTQGELQDMGMTWARQGCAVLIPDHLGHGERRQHPFRSEKDFSEAFRVGRQDYYFRHNLGMQLHAAGESLMGWMVWDLMRCVDVLLARPGIDAKRIILLGAVAGGGDPAGVTAALDPRVAAVAPFNFGGPQPDYAIPPDAENDFYYFGIGYWESTRCLRLSARDGFAHWVIVASLAPRRLIYAHEFAWERERDPVWPRVQQVFRWHDAEDHLAVATGQGNLKGSPPESSHCNNIGPLHRSRIYPALERWFDMPVPEEFSKRRTPDELLCLTPETVKELGPRPLHELLRALGSERSAAARQRLQRVPPEERRRQLRQDWARLLGNIEPKDDPKLLTLKRERLGERLGEVAIERIALEAEPGISVPLLLLFPGGDVKKPPVVIGMAHEGKNAFLRHRAKTIAELLEGGVAVCLPDLRGTGETRPDGDSRGRSSSSTSIWANEAMLGGTLLGARLRDLRSVIRYLRTRDDLNGGRIALWGDSFAPVNPQDRNLAVPLDAPKLPAQAEPLGGLLALFGALFEHEPVRAVSIQGGLVGYHSLLDSPFCYVPHDILVPDALTAGDLCDVAAALAPRPLRLDRLVDAHNRQVNVQALARVYETAHVSSETTSIAPVAPPVAPPVAQWLLQHLKVENR